MRKRLCTLCLTICILLAWAAPALAVQTVDVKVNDAAPVSCVLLRDRTYVPLRFIAENLAYTVDWDWQSGTTISNGTDIIRPVSRGALVSDRDIHATLAEAVSSNEVLYRDLVELTIPRGGEAYKNGSRITFDSAIFEWNYTTYVPVRFIAEALGAGVDYVDGVVQISK